MKAIQLEQIEMAGNRNPLNTRCFCDGKKVTFEKFMAVKKSAVKIYNHAHSNQGGNNHFYSTIEI